RRLDGAPPADAHQPALDEAGRGAAPELGAAPHEELVEALAGLFGGHRPRSLGRAHQAPDTPNPSGLPIQPSCGAQVTPLEAPAGLLLAEGEGSSSLCVIQ